MKRSMHLGAIALAMIALGAQSDKAQSSLPQAPAAQAGSALTIPSGQKFIMRLETALHTRTTRKGDRVEFSTAADVTVGNQVLIPNKSWVRGTVTKAKRAGRLFGRSEIRLRFDEIKLADGTVVPLQATLTRAGFDPVSSDKQGDPGVKGDVGPGGDIVAVAQGGMQGAIMGLPAGGKGAMYGAAIGAGITMAAMILRRGPDLDLPRNTMFEARFDKPLEVPFAATQAAAQPVQAVPQPEAQLAQTTPPTTPVTPTTAGDPTSPPRPKLTRGDRVEAPPVESPPASKPTEAPPPAVSVPPSSGSPEERPVTPGGLKLSVNVRMVLVDTVVKDKAGHMIENLTRDDFLVYEDGVQQDVQSFSRDELPLAVALIIDRSGSVAPYIAELRRIAERTLQQLKPEDEVALFSFAASVDRVEDLTTDRQRIANGIAGVRAGGGTNIIDALYESVSYLAKAAPERRHAIILISDNQPTVASMASEGETIRRAMESETVVYSIKTSGQALLPSLQLPSLVTMASGSAKRVAQDTGGEVIDARNVTSLDDAMAGVISRLRMRYCLGYYPSKPGQGAFHTIVVRLVDRLGKPGSDYFLHARRGYYATADRKTP